jgi:hypothetical protein
MDVVRCSKYQFHEFAEQQQHWFLLFDAVIELGSCIGYLLPNGQTIFVRFDSDGFFSNMSDTYNAVISINNLDDE